jgi:hypothetical protein
MTFRLTPPFLAPALVLASALGCRPFSDAEAEKLVRTYNTRLMEAFRTGDEQVMEGLVGDEEGKKLLGLIGVKADMGMNLDSALTEFRVLRVERPSGKVIDVVTEERWHYLNRQIGTGLVVGMPSDDHYVMRYALAQEGKTWVVSKVAFEKPPVVGRDVAPNQAPAPIFHGMVPASPGGPASSERTRP